MALLTAQQQAPGFQWVTLAWRPQHLSRVAGILVRLSTAPVKGNWGNTPLNPLTSLFRSWLPQTAVSIEQRIQVLDRVIAQDATIHVLLIDINMQRFMKTSMLGLISKAHKLGKIAPVNLRV